MSFSRLQLLGRGRMSGLKPTLSWAGNSSRHRSTQSNIRPNRSSTCHASALSPRTQRPRAPAKHLLQCPSFRSPLCSPGKLTPAPGMPSCAQSSQPTAPSYGASTTQSHSPLNMLYTLSKEGFGFFYFKKCSIDKQTAASIQRDVIK